MAYIPLTGLQQSSKKTILKESLRSQTESGYMFSRAKFTQPKSKFSLDYLLNKTDFSTLEIFFINNSGSTFNILWNSMTYTVIFTIDELDYTVVSNDVRKCTITLIEV